MPRAIRNRYRYATQQANYGLAGDPAADADSQEATGGVERSDVARCEPAASIQAKEKDVTSEREGRHHSRPFHENEDENR